MASSHIINFPSQKLPDSKKTEKWFKECLDFSEHLIVNDEGIRSSIKNKQTNYNLRSNIINKHDFQKYINPSKIDLSTIPAEFQHIGIENSKINLLIGEYIKRHKEFIVTISASDKDSIGRKEEAWKQQLAEHLNQIIYSETSEEAIQLKMQKLQQYFTYEFQDVGEIVANKILKREYKTQNFAFLFQNTFEDLLTSSEQICMVDILGGLPVIRRIDPRNVEIIGNNGYKFEDSDIIVVYDYFSPAQIIDDYWDVLNDSDVTYLETGHKEYSQGTPLGLNRNMSIGERYGEDAIMLLEPGSNLLRMHSGAFNSYGKIRVLKTYWRSRRKIGKRKFFDEFGVENYDFVPDSYKAKKELGEEITWLWVNEWMEGTKIGDDIYINMRPCPVQSGNLVNRSVGTPPIIGTYNSWAGNKAISLIDVMKPLSFSYDIAYYKRELAIATSKGNLAAINASMIPSGWSPSDWINYATVNKFLFLDPTNEILKGAAQGKSAGIFNTITATKVDLDDTRSIQMYTDLLMNIEDTLGKIAGVSQAREAQIQTSEAVGNVNRQITQSSHITEKWFSVDANFRKRVLQKFVEVAQFAYKKHPKLAEQIFGEIGMNYLDTYEPFATTNFDIHLSDESKDTQLMETIMQHAQAAIQNGNATIADLVAIERSESIQEVTKRLEEASERIKLQEQELQEQQIAASKEQQEKQAQIDGAKQEFETMKHKDEMSLKQRELDLKEQEMLLNASIKEAELGIKDKGISQKDSDKNGIKDTLDLERTRLIREKQEKEALLKEQQQKETIRHNKKMEEIANKKASTPNKSA